MIQVSRLTKRYGRKTAVDNISFSVGEGEILGFLGPNGAGKSTTMNMITGYLSSNEGVVTIGGHDILEQPKKAKALMGYLPEHPPLYLEMTVWEYLCFLYHLKRLRLPRQEHILDICGRLGLEDVLERRIGNLSKGYRQRVGLAQALLGNPPVLILDEPTIGLDPRQIIDIRRLIQELGKQHTIILSSHILPEVQAICNRVIVIHQGQLLADDTPGQLARSMEGGNRLSARIEGPQQAVEALLLGLSCVAEALPSQPEGDAILWEIVQQEGADIRRELFFALAEGGYPMLSLKGGEMTLEEIFLELTARAEAAALDEEQGSDSGEDMVAEGPTEEDADSVSNEDQEEGGNDR